MKRTILVMLLGLSSFLSISQTVSTLVPTNVGDDLHFGTDGFLYSTHYGGEYVRKINPENGHVDSILMANTSTLGAIELDQDLNIYTCSWDNGWFGKFQEGDDDIQVILNGLAGPAGIAGDDDGNMYLATNQTHKIIRVDQQGNQEIYFNGAPLFWPTGITIDPEGNLYVANMFTGQIIRIDSNQEATVLATLPSDGDNDPDIAYLTWTNDRLFICHIRDNVIYQMDPTSGDFIIIAGSGEAGQNDGEGLEATFHHPTGIAANDTGTELYVTDGASPNHRLRRITLAGANGISENNESEHKVLIHEIFSNPNNGRLCMKVSSKLSEPILIYLYNASGNLVKQESYGKGPLNREQISIDISHLSNATYIVEVQSTNSSAVARFVKH